MAEILNMKPKNEIRRIEIESAKQFIRKYVKFAVSIIYENNVVTVRLWGRGGFYSVFNYSIQDYAKSTVMPRGLNDIINRGELIDQHVIYTHDDNGNLWLYTIQLLRFRLYGAPLYATRVIENKFNGRLIYGKALFFVDIFRTPYGQDISEINEKINEFFSRLNVNA